MPKIKIKESLSTNEKSLDTGELLFNTDTKQLKIGTLGGKYLINTTQPKVREFTNATIPSSGNNKEIIAVTNRNKFCIGRDGKYYEVVPGIQPPYNLSVIECAFRQQRINSSYYWFYNSNETKVLTQNNNTMVFTGTLTIPKVKGTSTSTQNTIEFFVNGKQCKIVSLTYSSSNYTISNYAYGVNYTYATADSAPNLILTNAVLELQALV